MGSGSRTLLRLHRALEYITEFLGRLEPLEDEAYLSTVSREAYEKTLMKYHPWIVQKAAKLAMGMLPTKVRTSKKGFPSGGGRNEKCLRQDSSFLQRTELIGYSLMLIILLNIYASF